MRQAGLKPDKHAANAAVARWLREVANARVHATTNEILTERLVIEVQKLQPLATPYAGRSIRSSERISQSGRVPAAVATIITLKWPQGSLCAIS